MEFTSVGFESILSPKNECPYIGHERERKLKGGITLFIGQFGSYRFVLKIEGVTVSGLQVMSKEGRAVVANAITLKDHRRKGYARTLFNEAKKWFPNIQHSTNLSADGKAFASACQ